MNRIRIATTALAIVAVGAFLMGCGGGSDTRTKWQAASTGGAGGGTAVEGTSVLAAEKTPDQSGVAGVLAMTESSGVALTFDDGPDPNYTPKMLELLRKHNVKATFCLVGVQVQEFPHLVRDIVADGHTLCNHTWKHDTSLGKKAEDAIRADMKKTQDAILAAAPGATVKYFRHPGGMWTPRAVKVAKELGMASIGWDVDTSDWNIAKYHAGPAMRDHILQVLRTSVKPGSIVLAHDAGGDRSGTLAAFEIAMPELAAKFKLVAL
jgi:peptidoglycan/xylan/chitin deacetylase (PgdA/CDA1 family)